MNKKIFLLVIIFLTISCGTQKTITEKDLRSSYDKFSTFIWSKNKNDSIVYNKKNLDLITFKKGEYYRKLGRYISYLIHNDSILKTPLTFSERSNILGHLMNYMHISHNSSLDMEILILSDKDYHYYSEFEKNNYYNLPNLKKEYRRKFEELKPTKKLDLKPVIDIIDKSD
ncbi:hypothetical protein [Tenacibaculum sp. SDUM215027]|uniref:hypothetical protein n=1 Tax=Tenacibaculum sp. SDUM215027 TaxID=3422596 RepID=UPI003D323EC3